MLRDPAAGEPALLQASADDNNSRSHNVGFGAEDDEDRHLGLGLVYTNSACPSLVLLRGEWRLGHELETACGLSSVVESVLGLRRSVQTVPPTLSGAEAHPSKECPTKPSGCEFQRNHDEQQQCEPLRC